MSSTSRERILEVASELVRERGASAVTMAEVARAAGVSRQMVYLHFQNRAGLFTAITRWHDERAGIEDRFRAAFELEPVAALEAAVRAWLAYVPEILPIARELHAAAMTGQEGGEAWHLRMDELRRMFRAVARRLDLREPWTADSAGDWIWSRAHVTVWDQLVNERGWTPEAVAGRTVSTLLAELVGRVHSRPSR